MITAPEITIYVRHGVDRHGLECPHKQEGEDYPSCNCRKSLRWTLNGKQYRRTAKTRSWTAAKEAARRLVAELVKSDEPEKVVSRKMGKTIQDARDAFLKGKKVKDISPDAYKKYEREILRFLTFCERRGVFTLDTVDAMLLVDYKATWPELFPSTATRALVQQLLRVFLNYCHAAGWITRVPKMDPVKIDEPPTLPLTEKEYKALLAAVPLEFTNGSAARVRAVIQLMRWSGLAVRDASCLRSDELLLSSKGIYRVVTSRQKTGVHVEVPIPPDAAEDILAGANKGAAHLFYKPDAGSAVNFSRERSREISRAFERAGIHCAGHMVSHRLRDTFAVSLLSKGLPMEEVSKLLGHKSISTTERHYSAWVKGRQDRLNALVTATWK